MGIKLSVIIPAYNVEDYIEVCLDSILAQTFDNFEVIIIDDGSTDSTPHICDQYVGKDKRITVIHQPNRGVSAARNLGIEKAVGEYIIFFDADDFAENYTFEQVCAFANENKADAVIYGYHRYKDGNVTQTCPPIFDEGIYEGNKIISDLLSRFVGISFDGINRWLHGESDGFYVENPALWRILVSRQIIEDNHLRFNEQLKVGEDTVFISDYLSCSKRCYVTSKCFYYLVLRESSTISRYEKNALAKLDGKEKLLDARYELTDRIKSRKGADIKEYWLGTVVMSCVELAFLLSRKMEGLGFGKRYKLYLKYALRDEVRTAVKEFPLKKKFGIKSIPFLMLKWGLHFILFMCTTVLNAVNYQFVRG